MITGQEQYELVGEHTRKVYKLGQKVRVRVSMHRLLAANH